MPCAVKRTLQEIGRIYPTNCNKTQLQDAVRAAAEDARRGNLSVRQSEESAHQSQSGPMELLMSISLRTWVMEPMEPTAGIREGTRNDPIVLLHLPRFFETHGSEISNNLQIDIVRTTRLLCDSEFAVMAASLMQYAALISEISQSVARLKTKQ